MDKNMDKGSQNKPKSGYGYGKKSILFWVLVYLVIGAVVYGAIYLWLTSSSGSNGGGGFSY